MSAFSTLDCEKICIILYCASRPFVPETRHVLWNQQPLIWTILVRFFAGNNLNLDYWCCIQETDELLWSQIHCFLRCAICVFVSFQTCYTEFHTGVCNLFWVRDLGRSVFLIRTYWPINYICSGFQFAWSEKWKTRTGYKPEATKTNWWKLPSCN